MHNIAELVEQAQTDIGIQKPIEIDSVELELIPELIAYHEAGHLISFRALYQGRTVKKAMAGNTSGVVYMEPVSNFKFPPLDDNAIAELREIIFGDPDFYSAAIRRAAVHFAGHAGERIYMGDAPPIKAITCPYNAEFDWIDGMGVLSDVGLFLSGAWLSAQLMAYHVLTDNWKAVEVISEALQSSDKLNEEQIEELLSDIKLINKYE